MDAGETNVLLRRPLQIVATAALLALASGAGAQELLFSPNLKDIVPRQFEQANTWSKLPPGYTFGTDLSGSYSEVNAFRNPRELPPASGSSSDQFRVGTSYLEIQTLKNLQPLDVLRRGNCETDEECAEYSGLPKAGGSKGTLKGV